LTTAFTGAVGRRPAVADKYRGSSASCRRSVLEDEQCRNRHETGSERIRRIQQLILSRFATELVIQFLAACFSNLPERMRGWTGISGSLPHWSVRSILKSLVALLACSLCLHTSATVLATTEYRFVDGLHAIASDWGSDKPALCSSLSSKLSASPGWFVWTEYDDLRGACLGYQSQIGTGTKSVYLQLSPASRYICPAGSSSTNVGNPPRCLCDSSGGYQEDPAQTSCQQATPEPPTEALACKAPQAGSFGGNPIFPASAEKVESQQDWIDSGPAPLSVVRHYRSTWGSDTNRASVGLGKVWTHNHAWRLKTASSAASTAVSIISPEGYVRGFAMSPGARTWAPVNSADALAQSADGWLYKRAEDDAVLAFDPNG